jgi:hypothetical protein
MKRTIQILTLFFIISCNNNYDKEELNVIKDIANEFLVKKHLNKVLKSPFEEIYERPLYVDTLDLKVYLSDALLPISQIKEDNEWMFENNHFEKKDSIIFYSLINSKKFKDLKYREFEKNKIKFEKPYRQFEKSKEKIKENEEYSLLNFSRICLDEKEENGLVVIEYKNGKKGMTIYGSHMVYLISKNNNKWELTSRKINN